MSHEGKKAIEMFESSCKRVDGRFVIGLAWKRDFSQLLNNYSLARQCLESLERNLRKNKLKVKIYDNATREKWLGSKAYGN